MGVYVAIAVGALLVFAVVWYAIKSVRADARARGGAEEHTEHIGGDAALREKADEILAEPVADESRWLDAVDERVREYDARR
jgi:hypothetical protein